MKTTRALLGILTMTLGLAVPGGASEPNGGTGPTTNGMAVLEGWLQLSARELVLDLRHESLAYGARQGAGEFLAALLNLLLGADYTVRLSDEFIHDEIAYYRANLSREVPVEMSGAILSCLEKARASGVLDWDCFKSAFSHSTTLTTAGRHLPWLAPPLKAKAVRLAGADGTNLTCLRLSLKWTGRTYRGGVQYSRRPGGLPGETVLREGQSTLWAFAAVVRLERGGRKLFEKAYPREEWQRTYVTAYERPLWKTSQAILQDLATGLKAKPPPPGESGRKQPRKHPNEGG
jgi:hypothetical protein